MEYIWILIIMMIVFRFIQRLGERPNGTSDEPLGGPSPGHEELPFKSAPQGEESEYRPKLNIPEYLTRRSDEPGAGDVASARGEEPPVAEGVVIAVEKPATVDKQKMRLKEYQDYTMNIERPVDVYREGARKELMAYADCAGEASDVVRREDARKGPAGPGPLDGMICPGELIKGILWSEILGSRGGLQVKRRVP